MREAAGPPRRSIREQIDLFALVVIQPVVAAFAAVGLLGDRTAAQEITRPFLVWGGLLLLALIFAEGVWSFASRHMRRQGLGVLWVKLVGAGLCAILSFAAAYRHLGLVDNGLVTHRAGVALYFSVTAWTTVGFGDVVATVQARPFAAAQALAGFVFNSALIGLMLHALTVTSIAATREETDRLS